MDKKTTKQYKKLKKFIKIMNSKKIFYTIIDNELYIEDKRKKTKVKAPDEMQNEIFKKLAIAIQNKTDKEYIKEIENNSITK